MKPPVVWHRLENSTPVIGPAWQATGTPDLAAGAKFGNGHQKLVTGAHYVETSNFNTAWTNNCTIEFWLTPNQNTDNGYHHLFNIGNSITLNNSSAISGWLWHDIAFPGFSGIRCGSRDTATNRTNYYWAFSYTKDVNYHIAFVHDSSQGAREKHKLYINGADQGQGTIQSGQDNAWNITNGTAARICCGLNDTNHLCKFRVDNLKIYDYKKTDFSDRNNERGGMDDQVIIT